MLAERTSCMRQCGFAVPGRQGRQQLWCPPQAAQLATYVQAARGVPYAQLDPREANSGVLFSGSGFGSVVTWLNRHELGVPAGGAGCATLVLPHKDTSSRRNSRT
jgi:hypothetical protein